MRRFTICSVAMFVISIWLMAMPAQAALSFADPAFERQWKAGEAIAPNFWGPLDNAQDGKQEPYKEAQGGQRLVQYFDKGRMELTNGTVTNGLLATDLVKGQVQIGDQSFQSLSPPAIPIAGDPDNPGPTYAQLNTKGKGLFDAAPKQTGNTVQASVLANDDVIVGSAPPSAPATFAVFDDVTKHNVPQAFADYRTKAGLASIGYALSEPFYATVRVGGAPKQVIVQVFERRVLTYTPSNPDAFKVEMGNIGQHYFLWRYGSAASAPSAPPAPAPSTSAAYPGKIVYETGTGDANAPVYVMNADGSGKVKVGDGRSPLFSPDGKRVAFYAVSPIPTSRPFPDVIIRSTDFTGANARDEVVFSTSAFQTLIRWSPSGHYIAVNSTQNGPGQISLFDTTTGKFAGELKYLQGTVNLVFDWTQDGNTALWQASKDFAGPKALFFGDPDTLGDGATQLTHGENQIVRDTAHFYTSARISPDGKTIAVAGTKVFFLSVPGQVSPLDGKSLDGLSDVYSLSWSPDGRALAVARRLSSSRGDTGRSLSIVDIASGQVITTVPGAGRADWSRQ